VYHGSPHKFDSFDASKIGTGEGAQAYGHGLYFAENPNVAQQYKDQLSPRDITRKTKTQVDDWSAWAAENADDANDAMSKIDNLISTSKASSPLPKGFKDWDAFANFAKQETQKRFGGSLYKVDLPDAQIAKMLDFDKHLSEQSAEVKNILLPYQKEIGGSFGTGEQTLKAIAFERRMKGLDDSPAAVAQQLRDMGIPGIKYLDQGSRGASGQGKWKLKFPNNEEKIYDFKPDDDVLKMMNATAEPYVTRNFVTFPGEEQNLTILERNGQPMVARTQQQDATPDLMQYQQMLDDEERRKSAGLLFR
jgi:hypothetical protein